jgi:electron transport complex protein RnfD
MLFREITSPHSIRPNAVTTVMLRVILALVPGIITMIWLFGWGILINIILATITAVVSEAFCIKLRGRPVMPALGDLSAIVTALLFAIAIPPLLPWWLTVFGTAFAIILIKQMYGGLGYNPFNPAMAAYVLLLVSYPADMTAWLSPVVLNDNPLNFMQTMSAIFAGVAPEGMTWDSLSGATPLDSMKIGFSQNHLLSEIHTGPLWQGMIAGYGWEWPSVAFLLGGLWMIYKRVITWHIPVSMLGTLFLFGLVCSLLDPEAHPLPLFHLFSGGAMLGAFFIATDPVSACTTPRGRLIYGASIGAWIYIIRTWGGYPDAVAFAVLLLNMSAPVIDHLTQPKVYGHGSKK